jgi:site-specific DNA recombinase
MKRIIAQQTNGLTLAVRSAVAYGRVSSKEQEREGFSIPAQQKLYREYAKRNGLDIVAEFIDVETAKRAGRSQFGAMIEYLRVTNPRPVLLVEKTDRLYRNLKDYVLLDELGVAIHLIKEGEILSDESRSSQRFVHGIKVLMARTAVENLGEEASKGLLEKAEQGHWPSVAPIGFRNNRETTESKRILIEHPWWRGCLRRMQ